MSLKHSRQREAIKENLKGRTDHPTADMIYSDIRMIYPNVSLGTIYRNLALLSAQGEIMKINCEEGILRYDGNPKPHGHFICKSCGNISDFEFEHADKLKSQISKRLEASVDECVLTFYGLCKHCINKEKQPSND